VTVGPTPRLCAPPWKRARTMLRPLLDRFLGRFRRKRTEKACRVCARKAKRLKRSAAIDVAVVVPVGPVGAWRGRRADHGTGGTTRERADCCASAAACRPSDQGACARTDQTSADRTFPWRVAST